MQLDIQSRSFKLTAALKQAIKRSLSPLDQRYGSQLSRVQVRLSDINGVRGGVDKRCLIVLEAGRRHTVVAKAISADMYQAISQAGRRAEAALRQTRKRRKLKRL